MTEGFQPWPKIARLGKLVMTITEKLDGTNAQVHIINFGGINYKDTFEAREGKWKEAA